MALTAREEAILRAMLVPENQRQTHETWRLQCVSEKARLRAGTITRQQFADWLAANPEPPLPARWFG